MLFDEHGRTVGVGREECRMLHRMRMNLSLGAVVNVMDEARS